MFTARRQRRTIAAREAADAREAELQRLRLLRTQEREEDTRDIVAEEVRRTAGTEAGDEEEEDGDDEEEEDGGDAAFAAWKGRELARLRRARAERRRLAEEAEETERRRRMTDAELRAEDPARFRAKQRGGRAFMQRYYHRGAFYQDEGLGSHVDASAPTGEDKLNRALLPDVMRVKKFGFAGRTKYTHLADQDTTDRSFAWGAHDARHDARKRRRT